MTPVVLTLADVELRLKRLDDEMLRMQRLQVALAAGQRIGVDPRDFHRLADESERLDIIAGVMAQMNEDKVRELVRFMLDVCAAASIQGCEDDEDVPSFIHRLAARAETKH